MENERQAKLEVELRLFIQTAKEWMKAQNEHNKSFYKTGIKVERMEAKAGIISAVFGLAAGFIASIFHKGG